MGKSSLINSLKRARVAQVGNAPGITRSMQQINLDKHINLLDSPGIVFSAGSGDDAWAALRNCVKVAAVPVPVHQTVPYQRRTSSGTRHLPILGGLHYASLSGGHIFELILMTLPRALVDQLTNIASSLDAQLQPHAVPKPGGQFAAGVAAEVWRHRPRVSCCCSPQAGNARSRPPLECAAQGCTPARRWSS